MVWITHCLFVYFVVVFDGLVRCVWHCMVPSSSVDWLKLSWMLWEASEAGLIHVAHVVTGTRKFDCSLGQILHDELHWLDVFDRVFFKLAVTVHRCLNGCALRYLSDCCASAAGVDTRQHLPSANRLLFALPRYWLKTYGRWAFSVAGPTVWYSLPDFIRDPTISADSFRRLLKTYLFAQY